MSIQRFQLTTVWKCQSHDDAIFGVFIGSKVDGTSFDPKPSFIGFYNTKNKMSIGSFSKCLCPKYQFHKDRSMSLNPWPILRRHVHCLSRNLHWYWYSRRDQPWNDTSQRSISHASHEHSEPTRAIHQEDCKIHTYTHTWTSANDHSHAKVT